MADWLGHTTTFAYDSNGNLLTTTLPSGTSASTSHTYDGSDTLTDTSVTLGSSTTDLANLTRNADQNIATSAPPSGGTTTYGYDALNRVTSGSTQSYAYNTATRSRATRHREDRRPSRRTTPTVSSVGPAPRRRRVRRHPRARPPSATAPQATGLHRRRQGATRPPMAGTRLTTSRASRHPTPRATAARARTRLRRRPSPTTVTAYGALTFQRVAPPSSSHGMSRRRCRPARRRNQLLLIRTERRINSYRADLHLRIDTFLSRL